MLSPIDPHIILVVAGLLAGLVDSIAGGGGLINLPVLTLHLGPGPDAIGTNKIVGTVAALVALIVYIRGGHMDFRRSLQFTISIGFGALGGSLVAPLLPIQAFQWFLVITCPIVLWAVWNRQIWVQQEVQEKAKATGSLSKNLSSRNKVLLAGLACGFYDGVWGPGGGTFMFLSLLIFAKMPLLQALAASKLANTCSAAVALSSYAISGHVFWFPGTCMAMGVALGAWIGAKVATRNAIQVVRPVLVIVVGLLVFKLVSQWSG